MTRVWGQGKTSQGSECDQSQASEECDQGQGSVWDQGQGSEWGQGQGSEWDQGQGSGQGLECGQAQANPVVRVRQLAEWPPQPYLSLLGPLVGRFQQGFQVCPDVGAVLFGLKHQPIVDEQEDLGKHSAPCLEPEPPLWTPVHWAACHFLGAGPLPPLLCDQQSLAWW